MAVRATISGLTHDTTYHYRVVATNASGTHAGADKTFRTATPAALPSISSRAATGVTGDRRDAERGRRTRAALATDRALRVRHVDLVRDRDARRRRSARAARASSCAAPVGGLKPNTRYNFRAVATSAAGITRGSQPDLHDGASVPTGVAVTPSTVRPDLGQRR